MAGATGLANAIDPAGRASRRSARHDRMNRLVAVVVLLALSGAARAESCSASRDYLLGDLAGDRTMPPQAYKDLFRICMATIAMTNVKDAYLLKDGGIAVSPKQDGMAATAATLAQFCNAYPRATLRFLSRKDMLLAKSVSSIVRMSSTSSTSCKTIKGLS